MSDWTRTETARKTPYGTIYYGGACRDNYRNIVRYDQGGGHTIFWLQLPAMRAWLAAQCRYARRQGWTKARVDNSEVKIQRKTYTEGKPIIVLAGTNRTCATQASLYRSDTSRYAPPQYTGHTRGLAVDVSQNQTAAQLRDIRAALLAEGWKQARSDEPWHYSYHVSI